ncbi:ComF family protein [Candidatus Saccharibacteria bacterium]|nr:ComF family protein [Candidatus Saccharibacteria bacterium]
MSLNVKNTTFPNIFDLLAPHSCRGCGRIGNALCDCCKNNIISNHLNICPNCKGPSHVGHCERCRDLPKIFIVGPRNELIGELVQELKFHSVRSLAKPLAEILNEILPDFNTELSIVPLPTIQRHIRERGLDHTFLIAKNLKKLRKNCSIEKLLLREKNTVQVGSDEKTRLKQASSAYKINKNIEIDNHKTYLLLDDVWTTGATAKSALKKLQEAGAKNIVIAILTVNRLNQS